MGWMMVVGSCMGCGRVFSFNAERVPSMMVEGRLEPICRDCVERANPMRAANGLPPIVPLPGAYEPEEVV